MGFAVFRLIAAIFLLITTLSFGVQAAQHKNYATLVVDVKTGEVLHQENAGKLRYPASLTKMMTLYLMFEAIENKSVDVSDKIIVSKYAASQPKTNMGLKAGEKISVRNAIMSLIIKSANDVSVAVAEHISGSEDEFAKLMSKRAKNLGMKNTVFTNPHGLPDVNQKTTAYDLARLAIALKRDFPKYYHLFALKSFTFKGIDHKTHNHVVKNYPYADGLKTGFTGAAGYNLATSAKKGNKEVVSIVLGGNSYKKRDEKMVGLLNKYLGTNVNIQPIKSAKIASKSKQRGKNKTLAIKTQKNRKK
jgi:D-alanyl-D-alanine carboxypeptidase